MARNAKATAIRKQLAAARKDLTVARKQHVAAQRIARSTLLPAIRVHDRARATVARLQDKLQAALS